MLKLRSLALLSLIALAACSGKKEDAAPAAAPTDNAGGGGGAAPSADDQKKADEIFANRCAPCHGPEGRGDGPASAGLTPKPRNFHDAAWHSSVDDAYLIKIIQYGGAAVGKSAAMPPNPDLNDKPGVLAALKNKIRTFKGN